MDISNIVNRLLGRQRNILRTPYGTLNLAKAADRQKAKKIAISLQRTTDPLTRKDIADWRMAWQMAINVDSPNRQRLYDIYNDVQADAHLSGCVRQREGFVLARAFKLVGQSGAEDEKATHLLEQAWFRQLCQLALDSVYYGHSLIELGDIVADGDGCPAYDGVRLIPRKHVIPEYHRVIPNLGQDWTTGIDYHQPPFSDYLIEAGRPDDLGLFLKAAIHTIPKKNMLAFWDTFGEIFGMPMRIAKTSSRDQKAINDINDMLKFSAANLTAVLPMDTEIEFMESAKGDAFNVYDKRVDRCNSELSKLIVGQTMTIEDGSSLSQSQTHLEVFENLVEADRAMLRDIVNNQLLPRMARHGFPVKGLRFDWDDSIDYTPEQQKAFEEMLLTHYDIDPRYFEDKYGVPCGQKQQEADPDGSPSGGEEAEPRGDPQSPRESQRDATGVTAHEVRVEDRGGANAFFD